MSRGQCCADHKEFSGPGRASQSCLPALYDFRECEGTTRGHHAYEQSLQSLHSPVDTTFIETVRVALHFGLKVTWLAVRRHRLLPK